jgi:histidine decarboxylase
VGIYGGFQNMLEKHDLQVWLNDFSNTVVIERPASEDLIAKWQLACSGDLAHIVVMSHVTKENLKTFVFELVQSRNSKN